MAILKVADIDRLTMRSLINIKGAYLRQLAHSVINGSLSVNAASRLFVNY
jgi:hypothetical protein